jgi:hypothetical protein
MARTAASHPQGGALLAPVAWLATGVKTISETKSLFSLAAFFSCERLLQATPQSQASARYLVRASRDPFVARRFAPRVLMVTGEGLCAKSGGLSRAGRNSRFAGMRTCQRKKRAVMAHAKLRKAALPAGTPRRFDQLSFKKESILTRNGGACLSRRPRLREVQIFSFFPSSSSEREKKKKFAGGCAQGKASARALVGARYRVLSTKEVP